jgi:ESS family glutamate:Na+ symporter
MDPILSFCGLCLLLLLGKFLRVKIRFLQILYLPASVIAGLIGLLLVQVFANFLEMQWVTAWTTGWSKLPGFLINIVFGALFLGVAVPKLSSVWKIAGPQLAYGQIVAWGQYVIGLGIVLLVLAPIFGVPHIFGVIVPVGFEGGHGTAAAMRDSFRTFGWPEGADYALVSATAGILSAVIVGIGLINWAARKGYTAKLESLSNMPEHRLKGVYQEGEQPEAGRQTVSPDSVDSLALHLAFLGLAILIGYGIKQGMLYGEGLSPLLTRNKIFQGFPLFPLCMIGGLVVQWGVSKTAKTPVINHALMQRWAGTALDFLVVAAISTIQIKAVASGLLPLLLIVAAGIAWNLFCVMFLARRMFANCWFERSIAEMGQSMGVTATGLLLLRAVDPQNETDAPKAFGYKQLLHEPIMGGGLWTASAVPLIVLFKSGWPVFAIATGAVAAWFFIWFLLFRPAKPA